MNEKKIKQLREMVSTLHTMAADCADPETGRLPPIGIKLIALARTCNNEAGLLALDTLIKEGRV